MAVSRLMMTTSVKLPCVVAEKGWGQEGFTYFVRVCVFVYTCVCVSLYMRDLLISLLLQLVAHHVGL